MVIDSKYTRILSSDDLTRQKYDELRTFAVAARDLRNRVSAYVNANLLKYLNTKTLNFVTEMRAVFGGEITSSFDKHIYAEVLTCYQNKFAAVQRNLRFEAVTYRGDRPVQARDQETRQGRLQEGGQRPQGHSAVNMPDVPRPLREQGHIGIHN